LFTEIEKELRLSLSYHRKKAQLHFVTLLGTAILILVGGLLFGGYLIQLLEKAGGYALAIQNASIKFDTTQKDASQDLLKIATENNLGYAMLSGLIVFLFAVAGLLKHHINRSSSFEDRLFFIQKTQALSKDSVPDQVINALLHKEDCPATAIISPTSEAVEKISDLVISKLSTLLPNK